MPYTITLSALIIARSAKVTSSSTEESVPRQGAPVHHQRNLLLSAQNSPTGGSNLLHDLLLPYKHGCIPSRWDGSGFMRDLKFNPGKTSRVAIARPTQDVQESTPASKQIVIPFSHLPGAPHDPIYKL